MQKKRLKFPHLMTYLSSKDVHSLREEMWNEWCNHFGRHFSNLLETFLIWRYFKIFWKAELKRMLRCWDAVSETSMTLHPIFWLLCSFLSCLLLLCLGKQWIMMQMLWAPPLVWETWTYSYIFAQLIWKYIAI